MRSTLPNDTTSPLARLGSAVAVVRLVGSLCPVTEAHIDCFKQARSILLGKAADATCTQFVSAAQTPFVECIGLLSLNGERYVDKKLKEKGQRTISYSERHHLISLATADIPWLGPTATHAKWNDAAGDFEKLQSHYPALNFTCYTMNGASLNVCNQHRVYVENMLDGTDEMLPPLLSLDKGGR